MTGNMLRTLLPSIIVAVLAAVALHGQTPSLLPHVRIADPELRRLFDAGLVASPTLRALLLRLDSSDVVAYIRLEEPRRDGIDGSLQFVSAAAGMRYLLIRVVRMPTRGRQLALIAHELQHAVEVATAPQIVDLQTFTQEYERIGQASHYRRHRVRSFETHAALATGERVLKELDGRDLRRHPRPPELAALTALAPEVPSDD